MINHAVVLTSRRRAFPMRLLTMRAVKHVTIIAETGHPHQFSSASTAPNNPIVDVIEVSDIRDMSRVLTAVRKVHSHVPVDRVVSPVEFGVPTAAFLRSSLGIPGEKFDAGLAFADKFLMKQRLLGAGVATAKSLLADTPGDVEQLGSSVGWPIIVKPIFGALCMDVTRLEGPGAARDWADGPVGKRLRAENMPLAVEEYIEIDNEYHVDVIVYEGQVVFGAVSIYFDPLLGRFEEFTGSWIVPRDHVHHDEALNLATESVKALGLRNGVAHVELYQSLDGFRVGEAASRPAGGGIVNAIRHMYGIDLWEAFWLTSLGNEPHLQAVSVQGVVANIDLPIATGRIVHMSTEDEIRSVCPGVIDVQMTASVGDVVGSDLNSASVSGVVFLREPDEAHVKLALDSLRRDFQIIIEPA